MAPTMNKRIKQGNYDRLSEDEKRHAVKLNSDYYIMYPLELEKNKFVLSDEVKNESKSVQERRRNTAETNLRQEITINDFQKSNVERSKFLLDGASVLSKDWKLFKYASPEMEWVRKSLNALNSVRSESLNKYIENGVFKSETYLKRVNKAYDEFIEAAQNYVDTKHPGWGPGRRRKKQVENLLKYARQAKTEFNTMVDAIKDNAVDFRKMSEQEKLALNTDNIINKLESKEADGKVEWQNQGNSTDVYRMRLKSEDGTYYYLKENLPFLNQDIEGFFSRRISQLNASKKAASGNPDFVEEQRLKGVIDNADYDNCISFLTVLKNNLNSAGSSERSDLEARYAGYFARNFDTMFEDFRLNNAMAEFLEQNPGMSLDDQIANATGTVKAALQLKKQMLGDQAVFEAPKKMTAAQWVQKELGLAAPKDRELIDQLNKMNDQQVEKMFRYTLGKEVELFGQMSNQKIQNGSDSAAINNTATSRIAEEFGFNDVITKSKSALVRFERRDKTIVNKLCTISEEAEGDELVDIMKTAEKEGKKIIYGPEAIRQLMRLQAVDTLCMQKDRHGRNFKCSKRTEGNNIIIDTVKAYDNDMSFDNVDLNTAFEKDNKNQFLPGDSLKIKPGTALYNYTLAKYFGVDTLSKVQEVPLPKTKIGRSDFDLLKNNGLDWVVKNAIKDRSPYRIKGYSDLTTKASVDLDEEKGRFNYRGPENERKELIEKAKSQYKDLREISRKIFNTDAEYEKYILNRYACRRYCELQEKLTELWIRTPEEREAFIEKYKAEHDGKAPESATANFKMDLNDKDMLELDKTMEEMKWLDKNYNFNDLRTDRTNGLSMPHMFLQITQYAYDNTYADNIRTRILRQAKNPAAVTDLMGPDGSIEIPAMLHFDKEAHQALLKSVNQLRDPNSYIVKQLKELGFSQEKIDALKTRNEQQLEKVETAKKQAEKFYKAAGWEGKHPQSDFFLEKSDYKNFKDLSEFAVDPGKTYLAVENENFLAGQKFKMKVNGEEKEVSLKDFMSPEETRKAKEILDAQQKDNKRWKYEPGEIRYNDISQNPMTDKNLAANNVSEYIKACQADETYNRKHVAMDKQMLVESINKTVYLDTVRRGYETNKDKFTVDTVKSLVNPDSKEYTQYNKTLNSSAGKIYQQSMNAVVGEIISKNATGSIDEVHAKTVRDLSFEKSVDKIFNLLASKDNSVSREQVVSNVANLTRQMNELASDLGGKLDVNKKLAEFAQKNPTAVNQKEINEIKQAVKNKAPVEHKMNNNMKK